MSCCERQEKSEGCISLSWRKMYMKDCARCCGEKMVALIGAMVLSTSVFVLLFNLGSVGMVTRTLCRRRGSSCV